MQNLPSWLDQDPELVLQSVVSPRRREARLDVLGAVAQFRTLSVDQLAQITGRPGLLREHNEILGELFAAGLIDLGTAGGSSLLGGVGRSLLVRPARTDVYDKKVAPLLTRAENAGITGGSGWASDQQYPRHNALATTTLLRLAEFVETGGVAGELLSSYGDLAQVRSGLPRPASPASPDGVFLRSDGVAVALELQISVGPNVRSKIRRIAELLHSVRLADSGLVVLMVTARRRAASGDVHRQLRSWVREAVRDFPGARGDRTADRFFLAAYEDWFPDRHQVLPEFLEMVAWRPSGPVNDPWTQASILDVVGDLPFDPADPSRIEAALTNVRTLRGTPYWLRGGQRPPIWASTVVAAGFPNGIPRPPLARPERPGGQPVGSARGAAGATQIPRRLR
ncbi:hypothetical protein [Gryllotalpicola daejeonensis]|uniref:hypothetical protein n=1 Tax=Gryllotalpicola daejeonensis TaxID=993087 RepID=UPI0031D216B9